MKLNYYLKSDGETLLITDKNRSELLRENNIHVLHRIAYLSTRPPKFKFFRFKRTLFRRWRYEDSIFHFTADNCCPCMRFVLPPTQDLSKTKHYYEYKYRDKQNIIASKYNRKGECIDEMVIIPLDRLIYPIY